MSTALVETTAKKTGGGQYVTGAVAALLGQSVADLTALRALTPVQAAASPVQQVVHGYLYTWDGTSTLVDNGTTVITPASAPASGRWVRADQPGVFRPWGYGVARLAEARSRRLKVLISGTSIASFDTSIGKVFGQHLKNLYGDPGELDQAAGVLGGSWTAAYQGWEKQPFGGLSFTRARGKSTSSDLTFAGYFDTVEIEYSKESDGVVATVQIDGTTVGTFDCSGGQAYSQRATFTAPTGLGPHTVKILHPTSGFVYLERIRLVTAAAVGVDVTDASLGGSSVNNMVLARTPGSPQVNPIAIVGTAGSDAYYDRPDIDVHITSFVVNDAGANLGGLANFQTFKGAIDRAVTTTRNRGTALVFIIEMAGHFINPADPYSVQYNAIREYLLQLARENNHVYAVDWHALTAMSDVAAYAARWYPTVTGLNVAANTYSGDFIHPTTEAERIGTSALCAAFGIDPPALDSVSGLRKLWLSTWSAGQLGGIGVLATVQDSIRRLVDPAGVAYKATGGQSGTDLAQVRRVPYFVDDAARNLSDMPAVIAASGTTDKYGRYLTITSASTYNHPGVPFSRGKKYQLLVRGRNINIRSSAGSTFYVDGQALPTDGSGSCNLYVPNAPDGGPVWATVEWGATANNPFLTVVSGDYYEWYLVDADVPIKTKRGRLTSPARITTPVLMVGDADYNPDLIGQIFVEDYLAARTTYIRKRLVSSCIKWDFTTQTRKKKGLYECLDATAAGFAMGRLRNNGTMTTPDSALTGAQVDATNANPKWTEWASVSLATAGTWTIAHLIAGGIPANIKVMLFNGGNNVTRYLAADGTWSGTNAAMTLDIQEADQGEVLAFTLPIPTALSGASDLNTTTPALRIEVAGQSGFAFSTLAKGSSALA